MGKPVGAGESAEGGLGGPGGLPSVLADRDALAVDAARWRRLMREAPVSIAVYEPDGTLILSNERMKQLFGVTTEVHDQLVGTYNLIEDEQNAKRGIADHIRRAFAGERVDVPTVPYLVPAESEGGERTVWLKPSLQAVRDEHGEILELILVLLDVSEIEEARQQLDRQSKLLAEQLAAVQLLYDKSPVALCRMDADLRFLRINDRMAEINGRPRVEHLGRTLREVIPQIAVRIEPLYRQVFETGESIVDMEIVGRTPADPDKERVWLSNYHPVRGDDGSVWAVDTVVRDVTSLKRAERALRESEERFREMAAHIRDAFWLYDVRTQQVTYASPAFEAMWGLPVSELLRDPTLWNRSIHPEDRRAAETALRRVIERGQIQSHEYRVMRADGKVRWVFDRAFPVRDETGAVVRVTGIAEDVTERRQAQEALRQSEENLRTIIDHAPAVLWSIDAEGRFLLSEGRGLEALGLRPGEVVGRSIYEMYGDYPEVTRDARRALAGETVRSINRVSERVYETRQVPIRDGKGDVTGALGVAIDVTDRERAAETRRRLEKRIQETQRLESLGVLAGGIAHDFNNLLMGVLGNADLALARMPPMTPGRENVEQIETAALRAAELTNQMLAYSGKGRFVVQPLGLNQLVTEMGDLLRTVISKKASLQFELAPDLPAIEADASQIRQIVMNLITNASEALEDQPGTIVVRTTAVSADRTDLEACDFACEDLDGDCVALEVSDTGVGMDEATRRRIFDPFFTTKFAGRGLGLAGVLGIVRGHKGAVCVDSSPGRGTRFEILFPLTDRPVQDAPRTATRTEGTSQAATVLVADDDPMVTAVAQVMLEEAGYTVLTARDGQDAVDLFRRRGDEIDVVLLDMTMPRLGGEEAFRQLQALRADVPVILTSGYSEQEARSRFTGSVPVGFVHKPYRSADLLAAIRCARAGAASVRPAPGGEVP